MTLSKRYVHRYCDMRAYVYMHAYILRVCIYIYVYTKHVYTKDVYMVIPPKTYTFSKFIGIVVYFRCSMFHRFLRPFLDCETQKNWV